MAQYKVIQDIEADDKLLGPLTFRQFVYAGVTAFCLWFCYVVVAKGVPFLLPVFILPGLITAFFAFPWSKEQPTELWALARIRFLFKPRKRIWNQDGFKELVTITVPKKIEHIYSDGLSQTEVRSRLSALATTIDTRGWAIKNAATNPYSTPVFAMNGQNQDSSRLLSPTAIPMDVPATNETYADILDPAMNPKAEQFDSMLAAQAQNHRQQLMSTMQQDAPAPTQTAHAQDNNQQPAPDYWFLNQPQAQNIPIGQNTFGQQVLPPGSQSVNIPTDANEDEVMSQLRKSQDSTNSMNSHLPTLLPLAEQQRLAEEQAKQAAFANAQSQQAQAVTAQPDAAILDLARNDDLNISTIAREAQKVHGGDLNDEVVVSLH